MEICILEELAEGSRRLIFLNSLRTESLRPMEVFTLLDDSFWTPLCHFFCFFCLFGFGVGFVLFLMSIGALNVMSELTFVTLDRVLLSQLANCYTNGSWF